MPTLNKVDDLRPGSGRRSRRPSFSELASAKIQTCASCVGDPTTKRGQWFQIGQVCILVLVPFLMVVIQNSLLVVQYLEEWTLKDQFQADLRLGMEIGGIVHRLQIERGTTALYISSNGSLSIENRLKDSIYLLSDEALRNVSSWPEYEISSSYDSVEELHQYIQFHRDHLNPFNTTIRNEISFYSKIIEELITWLSLTIQEAKSLDIWQSLVAYHFLILSKEAAGVERAMGSTFYARGSFPSDDLLFYEDMRILSVRYLGTSMEYSSLVQNQYNTGFLDTELYRDLERMRTEIRSGQTTPSVEMGATWFDLMTLYIDFLQDVRGELLNHTVASLLRSIADAKTRVFTLISMTVIVACTLFLTAYFSTKLIRYIQGVSSSLHSQTLMLDLEKQRNEWLIHSILPASVARKLLQNENVPPEQYECVTIMFSDIVSFTQICAQSTPLQVVLMLNMIYAEFDDTLDLYDAYKVETIGDAYMVSSGLPVRNGDRHIKEIALLSIHMQSVVHELQISHLPGRKVQLRIGINSGDCVAGVVGHKSPRYCLFGDTVNTASRMESHGKPGLIHCSEASYTMLMKTGEFKMSPRGVVEIKGKGMMSTWWLNGTEDPAKSPSKLRPRSGSACGETLVNLPIFTISDNLSTKSGGIGLSRLSMRSSVRSSNSALKTNGWD